jgi:hypothetical protein
MLSRDIKVFCDLFCKRSRKRGKIAQRSWSLFKRRPPSSRYVSFILFIFLELSFCFSFVFLYS